MDIYLRTLFADGEKHFPCPVMDHPAVGGFVKFQPFAAFIQRAVLKLDLTEVGYIQIAVFRDKSAFFGVLRLKIDPV